MLSIDHLKPTERSRKIYGAAAGARWFLLMIALILAAHLAAPLTGASISIPAEAWMVLLSGFASLWPLQVGTQGVTDARAAKPKHADEAHT